MNDNTQPLFIVIAVLAFYWIAYLLGKTRGLESHREPIITIEPHEPSSSGSGLGCVIVLIIIGLALVLFHTL